MYCEKCSRVFEGERCPACDRGRVRPVGEDDVCFLAELDYVSSGILEDVLRQEGIPFLKKDVMGAGMAIKVGPMLERSRFYVAYPLLEKAGTVAEDLFAEADEVPADEGDEAPEDGEG